MSITTAGSLFVLLLFFIFFIVILILILIKKCIFIINWSLVRRGAVSEGDEKMKKKSWGGSNIVN